MLGEVPYGFIAKFQAFNSASKTPLQLSREIYDALRKHKQTYERMAEITVYLFEEAMSFDTAKARMSDLEELDFWKPSFSKRIVAAVDNNSQVSGAWGVPDRVTLLVKKWKKR
jgi:hypothetical protein